MAGYRGGVSGGLFKEGEMLSGKGIGEGVRKVREEMGMSQGDVVRQIRRNGKDVERNYLSTLETGKVKHPRIEKLHAILGAMGVGLPEFIFFCEIGQRIEFSKIAQKFRECIEEFMGPGWSSDIDLDNITSQRD